MVKRKIKTVGQLCSLIDLDATLYGGGGVCAAQALRGLQALSRAGCVGFISHATGKLFFGYVRDLCNYILALRTALRYYYME